MEALRQLVLERGPKLAVAAAYLVVIYIVYRYLVRILKKRWRALELDEHILNGLILLLRIAAIILAFTSISPLLDLPSNLFIGTGALLGTILGFGSSQTINNVVAGIYVLVSQPFKVKDYVLIDSIEGQVEEININYTSIYTPTFNLLKIPNTKIMNSKILNMTHEDVIKYSFQVSFSLDLPQEALEEKVLESTIKRFQEERETKNIRPPETYLEKVDRVSRNYMIRLFVPRGEAKRLFQEKNLFLRILAEQLEALKASG